MSSRRLALVTLIVEDYDTALAWYREKLGFEVLEDTVLGAGKRWVVVAPPGEGGSALLLASAANPEQKARIGDQTGGRVFLFRTRMIAGATIAPCRRQALNSVRRHARKATEPSLSSATFMATFGTFWNRLLLSTEGLLHLLKNAIISRLLMRSHRLAV